MYNATDCESHSIYWEALPSNFTVNITNTERVFSNIDVHCPVGSCSNEARSEETVHWHE